eukprot:2682601-Lingulodinium_polyedra.AAC.1
MGAVLRAARAFQRPGAGRHCRRRFGCRSGGGALEEPGLARAGELDRREGLETAWGHPRVGALGPRP